MATQTKKQTSSLVPLTKRQKSWPKLREQLPRTEYVVDAFGNVVAFSTKPSDLKSHIVWDFCGQCGWGLSQCDCTAGIKAPRSVMYALEDAGDIERANYSKTADVIERTARAPRQQRPIDAPERAVAKARVKPPQKTGGYPAGDKAVADMKPPPASVTTRKPRVRSATGFTGTIPDAQQQTAKATDQAADTASKATEAVKRIIRRKR